jgi:signal transduction histidine kinase
MTSESRFRRGELPFQPRARMLLLLGDQLIRDPRIAVFELVKNAYDADSPDATVTMRQVTDEKRAHIIVEDSGTGMDYDTIVNAWLEPGTDYRLKQRESVKRTPKYGRLPLGEKGVGRFAAHKLGFQVRLITRRKNNPEVLVDVDWRSFETHQYLKDVPVRVWERSPEVFTGNKTGTRIEITDLRDVWDRGMVRSLSRSMTAICSPFDKRGEFTAHLLLPEQKEWLKGLLSADEVLKFALFRAKCDLHDNRLSYEYRFDPFPAMLDKVRPRAVRLPDTRAPHLAADNRKINLDDSHVGPVHIDLYIFDRDPKMLALAEISDRQGLKEFLDESGGIRVYRDGIRVYDYGEPGNDWLNLGARRVNVPAQRISNNLVLGAVSLDLKRSVDLKENRGLIEKTNREGFVENDAFRDFRDSVFLAISQIEQERNKDKERIRQGYSPRQLKEPVLEDLGTLREEIEKRDLTKELGAYVERIEADFLVVRDRFLTSASAGLSLSVVIHEVEKGIAELLKAVTKEHASPRVKKLAKHLADLIEGFASLIRKTGTSREKASSLISQAAFNMDLRLQAHGVALELDTQKSDFDVKCSRRLVISTIMNLVDNSVWWLDNKWGNAKGRKRVYIGCSRELPDGPAIVVADNGPGFIDPPEYLTQPFLSRKPDGMGLGLHIADQVMKVQGGKLEFPSREDLSIGSEFEGAIVALVFKGARK